MTDLASLSRFAVELAWLAGRKTLAYFQTPLDVERKDDGTPVTRADREAEQALRAAISERYPTDGVLGEEYGDQPGTSGRVWVLDPIDGTKSFIHGVPLYGVLVGLVIDGRASVGAIHFPGLGETVSAYRGGGCWWNGRPAKVSATRRLTDAMVVTSDFPSHEQPSGDQRHSADALYAAARLRRTWGDAYGYALVATGRADVMIDPIVAPWDVAAVQPIIEEAGGTFTSLDGVATYDGGHGVGTNGHLHDAVLKLIAS